MLAKNEFDEFINEVGKAKSYFFVWVSAKNMFVKHRSDFKVDWLIEKIKREHPDYSQCSSATTERIKQLSNDGVNEIFEKLMIE